eukprot:3194093-Ditylum_brightwellii.AAC.1
MSILTIQHFYDEEVEHWTRIGIHQDHELDVVGLAWAPDDSHLSSYSLDSATPKKRKTSSDEEDPFDLEEELEEELAMISQEGGWAVSTLDSNVAMAPGAANLVGHK